MKVLQTNKKTYYVWQNHDGSLFITENGYESVPNAGMFINGMGGIHAVLDKCEEVPDPVYDGCYHGMIISYHNNGTNSYPRSRLAHVNTLEEAVKFIESCHTYNDPRHPQLVVTDNCRSRLEEVFSKAGTEPCHIRLRTMNCGCWDIVVCDAKADTLIGHQNIIIADVRRKREERIAAARAARDKRMTEMHKIKKGWYSVSLTFRCYQFDSRRGMVEREKIFSGDCVASSEMDAYLKAIDEVKRKYTELDVYDWGNPASESDFYCYFLGMKTDEGYSIEAWEEFSKTDEYKQSL